MKKILPAIGLGLALSAPGFAAEQVESEVAEAHVANERGLSPDLEVEMDVLRELLLAEIHSVYPNLDIDKIVFDEPKQSAADLVEIYGDFSEFGALGRARMRYLLGGINLSQEGCNINVGKTTMSISCDLPNDEVSSLN